jgi:hypothetical protein
MDDNNGNGNFRPINIDVSNDADFRAGVVKYLQLISDQTCAIPALKKKVETHDRIVQYGKWTGIPILAVFNILVKSLLTKLGL